VAAWNGFSQQLAFSSRFFELDLCTGSGLNFTVVGTVQLTYWTSERKAKLTLKSMAFELMVQFGLIP